jgi:sugar lactone lactonase YvrE
LRTGRDGRVYVAQVPGSQVSAIDIDSGAIETISPRGGDVIGPDDLAFDDQGNLYFTEITEGRVSMLAPNGAYRVIQGDMPVANPITFHQGRLIAGECRHGARIVELDRDGGAPRIILDNVPMANAFEVGPDGKLYFPVMGANEIWRVGLDGGEPEVVARDLGIPDSVKFDRSGYIVSTQVGSGQVLRIDPRTGAKTVLADLTPGLDNCTFVGDRLFVSHGIGAVVEILEPGRTRTLVDKGLQWPMGLAIGNDGELFVADGPYCLSLRPGGSLQVLGMLFTPGFPGFTRGVAAAGSGEWIVTTASGEVKRYRPAQQRSDVITKGYDKLMGVALAPGGAVIIAESGTGRVLGTNGNKDEVLASGLAKPVGVAVAADGTCYISEAEGGRVVKLEGGIGKTAIDGLETPEGIAIRDDKLFILDVGSKALIECGLSGEARRILASHLPVGAPPGVVPKYLGACGDLAGPLVNFAGISVGPNGTIFIAADGEGSILELRPE